MALTGMRSGMRSPSGSPRERATRRMTAAQLAAATPSTRDRSVDFLRMASILAVVLGHWLIAVVYWRGGKLVGQNALSVIPGIWILTWILQVMPLFFFVGGFSNATSLDATRRRSGGYVEYLYGRVVRLMRPTLLFIGVWLVVALALAAVRVPDGTVRAASQLVARPLWFMGIYLAVVALAPPMLALHRRWRLAVPLALLAGIAFADVARFRWGLESVGGLNYALVWLFAHQLGFFYADGTLQRLSARGRLALAAVGLAALVLLVNLGPYPGSMVGVPGDRISNMDPPTACLAALTLWEVGLAMLARDRLARWLSRIGPWTAVIRVNSVILTVFLWHLSAAIAAIAIAYPLGFPQPTAGTWLWWGLRPVWLAILAVVLAPLVLLFGRAERVRAGRSPAAVRASDVQERPGPPRVGMAAVGIVYVAIGVLGFAFTGFDRFAGAGGSMMIVLRVNPLQDLLHLAAGWLLLSLARDAGNANGVRTARTLADLALGFAAIGVAGILLEGHGAWNALAANRTGDILHLVTAGVILGLMGMGGGARRAGRSRLEIRPR